MKQDCTICSVKANAGVARSMVLIVPLPGSALRRRSIDTAYTNICVCIYIYPHAKSVKRKIALRALKMAGWTFCIVVILQSTSVVT